MYTKIQTCINNVLHHLHSHMYIRAHACIQRQTIPYIRTRSRTLIRAHTDIVHTPACMHHRPS